MIFNSNYENRHDIINFYSKPEDKYLEIGIANGNTFNKIQLKNKIGVDPCPNYKDNNIIIKTSDLFFLDLNKDTNFDIIFIDGMHQSEYVLNDINNSINFLSDNGIIIMDDILPVLFNEQIKIPNKHKYENGILKTLESWTGDIWKVMYHILIFYSKNIKFKYFSNKNYRGVAVINIIEKFQIANDDILVINEYDYYNNFKDYQNLLNKYNS
jgi:hypothetical protein